MSSPIDDPALPKRWEWLCSWFGWYCVRFASKHFHAVRLSKAGAAIPAGDGEPLVVVMNHPSWWDIILAATIANRLPRYKHFAPIDAEMLPQYRFFSRMGFFGIEQTARGAARFLRTAKAVFEQPYGAMWITAQGKFVDPRVRPIELRPGVGYVASRLQSGFVVPMAVEYPFWTERTPEALVRFGQPIDLTNQQGADGREWTARIEAALTTVQDALAAEAMQRDPDLFVTIVHGKVGVGGIYDGWRRLKAWAAGKKFDPAHVSTMSNHKAESERACSN